MQRRVWVVGDGDGKTVGAIVARAGGDDRAIADGRVFVGKKRANRDDEPVKVGDEIVVSIAPKDERPIDVLHSGDGILVVDKPAGISTIADQASREGSLLALAARAAGIDASTLHPTSRLDREVSGIVTFATSQKAAAEMLRAREHGHYVRRYVAIASKTPAHDHGIWNAAIGRARDPKLRAAFAPNETAHDAKPSRTHYRVVATANGHVLLACAPDTGRTHQIRVHASHAGAPLLGDRAYGGPMRLTLANGKILSCARIYLHCAHVDIKKGRKKLVFSSPIPSELRTTWASLGGDASAWDTALACDLSFSSD